MDGVVDLGVSGVRIITPSSDSSSAVLIILLLSVDPFSFAEWTGSGGT